MEHKQKVWIRGNNDCPETVIDTLTKFGGITRQNGPRGDEPNNIYYINHEGIISCCDEEVEYAKIVKEEYQEIKLNNDETIPVSQVIRLNIQNGLNTFQPHYITFPKETNIKICNENGKIKVIVEPKNNTPWNPSPDLLSGVELICMERERQIKEKGYTDEHDDNEIKESLVHAAVCYAIPYGPTRSVYANTFYPWGEDTFNPTPDNRIKELFKAGALIAAEIDRLQRLKL